MATLDPFRALLYGPGLDPALVTSPPYDVIAEPERERLESLHPYNIIKIILPSEEPGDTPGADKYSRAASRLREWTEAGVLVAEEQPRLYAYRMDYEIGGRAGSTGGVIGALELQPLDPREAPGQGGIHPHEHTMPKPRGDRLDLMRATQANTEPIWLVGGEGVVGPAVASASEREPRIDFRDPAGVRHRLWTVEDSEAAGFQGGLKSPLVIADGHHRYAAALTYRDEMREQHGPGPWDATLALVSDPTEAAPALLAIHRVTDLHLRDVSGDLVSGLARFDGDLAALADHLARTGPGTVGFADAAGLWTMPSHDSPDSAWVASVLEATGAAVTYEHDLGAVAAAVSGGRSAFLLAPIPVSDVIAAALAGRVMPPKSTLFWPKPRTGLLLRDHRLAQVSGPNPESVIAPSGRGL